MLIRRGVVGLRLCSVAALAVWLLAGHGVDSATARSARFGPATVIGERGDEVRGVAINASGAAIAVLARRPSTRGRRVLLVASRGAEGDWGRPVALDRGRLCSFMKYDVAMNNRGDAVVAWSCEYSDQRPQVLRASTRAAGRGWSAAKRVGRTSFALDVGITARGVAVLASVRRGAVQITTGRGSRWSVPRSLDSPKRALGAALDVHPNGLAAVVWSTAPSSAPGTITSTGTLMLSTRSRNGTWRPPETVPSTPPGLAYLTRFPWDGQVAITADGALLIGASWHTDVLAVPDCLDGCLASVRETIEVVGYRPGEGWAVPQTIRTFTDSTGSGLAMDLNDHGEAIIALAEQERYEGRSWVVAALRSASDGWTTPTQLNAADADASIVRVAITDGGQVFAGWNWGRNLDDARSGVGAATGRVASGWRKPVTIARPPSRPFSSGPYLAAANGPHAILGWSGPTAATVSVTR